MTSTLTKYSPWMLGLFRIVTALVFMEHGTQKLFHFPPPEQRFGGGGAGGRAASRALAQGADAASSAASSAVDAASSALSSAVDAVSSMASSIQPPTTGGPGREGMPPSMQTLFLVAGILETFGGLALVLGLLTRPIAFIVAGECAVIFWWMDVGHSHTIFPASNGGEVAVLFCFNFLLLVFSGPGAFALDNLIWTRRQA